MTADAFSMLTVCVSQMRFRTAVIRSRYRTALKGSSPKLRNVKCEIEERDMKCEIRKMTPLLNSLASEVDSENAYNLCRHIRLQIQIHSGWRAQAQYWRAMRMPHAGFACASSDI